MSGEMTKQTEATKQTGRRFSFASFALLVYFVLSITPAPQAQTLPDLPPVSFENFGPEIRDQLYECGFMPFDSST
jgi:hypothetical protein